MKTIGMLVMGTVVAGAVAQAAYTVKLTREVRALSARLGAPAAEDAVPGAAAHDPEPRRHLAAARAIPAFVPPAAPAPLPEAIASDSARDLLRGFVAAELDRIKHEKDENKRIKKDEKQQKKAVQNEKNQTEFRDRLAKELGLAEPEARRFGEILADAERTRRSLREAEKAGQATSADTSTALAALKTKMNGDLRTVLGDNWSAKLHEVDKRLQDNRKKDQEARGAANGPFWFVSNAARP